MIVAILSLIVSFIPAVLLYVYLRNLRRDDPGYRLNCRRLLTRGILCSFAVALLALLASAAWKLSGLGERSPLLKAAFRTVIIAACIEELVKYRTANRVIRKNMDTVSWLDCIAFVTIVGIGFQLIESVFYMLESNPVQILVRGFTMGHPAYGILMGYFIGKALHTGNRGYRAAAWGLPFLLHSVYDFSLADEVQAINDNFAFIPVISVIVELAILIRGILLIRKVRRGTEYTEPFLRKEEQAAAAETGDFENEPE